MEKLWYDSTLVAGFQEVYFKFLKVKPYPEFSPEFSVCFNIEELPEVSKAVNRKVCPLDPFNKFKMERKAEEEKFKSITVGTDSVSVTEDRKSPGVVSSKRSKSGRVVEEFYSSHIEEKGSAYRPYLADER